MAGISLSHLPLQMYLLSIALIATVCCVAAAAPEEVHMHLWGDTNYDMPFPVGSGNAPISSPFNKYHHKGPREQCYDFPFSTNFTGYEYVEDIISACNAAGEVCNTGLCGEPGPFFRKIEKKFDCEKMWSAKHFDQVSADARPPNFKSLPLGVQQRFAYGGAKDIVDIQWPHRVYDNKYYGVTALQSEWRPSLLEKMIAEARANTLRGSYGVKTSYTLRETLKRYQPWLSKAGAEETDRGRALVVGSEKPWVEAILLSVGFSHVTTLEYCSIHSTVPEIDTFTPDAFAKKVLAGDYEGDKGFDAVVIFSSVEHSGLGRYGDAINPFGDLIMLARTYCVTRSGGLLYLAVPSTATTSDKIYFNAHRIYGPVMFPNLAANWDQVAGPKEFPKAQSFLDVLQPLVVLRKGSGKAASSH